MTFLGYQVSDDTRPKTTFLSNTSTFTLGLPKQSVTPPSRASSGFETDFQNLFSPDSVLTQQSGGLDLTGSSIISKDDDWAAVDQTGEEKVVRVSVSERSEPAVPDSLPKVETLARPDILFRSLTPYLIHVTLHGTSKITVHGTHEPSLRLLSEYLQRWTKLDHQDVRKVS